MALDPRYDRTHRRIYETAIDLMCDQGYEKVTIEQICTASGVSRSSFYYHFKTKPEIVCAYFDQLGELTPERLAIVFAAPTACEKAIRMQLSYFVDRANRRYLELYIIHMKEYLVSARESHTRSSQAMAQVLLPLILQAQAAGEIRNQTPPEQLCAAAVSLQWGNMYQWCIARGGFDRINALKQSLIALYAVRPDIAEGIMRSNVSFKEKTQEQ